MATKLDIELADGRSLVVTVTLLDKVAFEVYIRNNPRFGSLGDNVIRMQAFWAWSAAKREHGLDLTWEEFLDGGAALDVSPHQDVEIVDVEEVDGLGEGIPGVHSPS